MTKKEIIDKIHELVDLMKVIDGVNTGSLFLHGDMEQEIVSNVLKGNMQVLSMAFGGRMKANPEFNQVMITMFAAFLVNNPDQKDAFIKTLKESHMAPGVN